jgi:hypothetical protein
MATTLAQIRDFVRTNAIIGMPDCVRTSEIDVLRTLVSMVSEEHDGEENVINGVARYDVTHGQFSDYAAKVFMWLTGDTDFPPCYTTYPQKRIEEVPDGPVKEAAKLMADWAIENEDLDLETRIDNYPRKA